MALFVVGDAELDRLNDGIVGRGSLLPCERSRIRFTDESIVHRFQGKGAEGLGATPEIPSLVSEGTGRDGPSGIAGGQTETERRVHRLFPGRLEGAGNEV